MVKDQGMNTNVMSVNSEYLHLLRDRINLRQIPFSERGSRLLIEGLQRSGYVDLARELRWRRLDLINSHDDIYEYYDPITGENPPSASSMFGWSSSVFIDLAIQAARERSQ
jgi:hypothetical protein